MPFPLLAAAVPAIGSAITGIAGMFGASAQAKLNARVSQMNTDKTILANRHMAEYAYSKDVESWNKQNEYNSPEQQQQRLSKAGLNPNLVYGSGAVANSSSQIGKYQAPTAEYNYRPNVDIPGMLAGFQNLTMKQAQTDNMRAQNELIKNQTLLAQANHNLTNKRNTAAHFQNLLDYGSDDFWNASPIFDGNKNKMFQSELYKTQMQGQNEKLRKDMNDITIKYQKMGSPAWQTIINFLRMIKN